MSYIPPRGACNHKASIVSSACTCLRFMIHPIKAPTSFECDGCGHHASFHQMQSKIDEEITARWTRDDGSFDREAYELDEEVQEVLARRRRLGVQGDLTSNGNLLMPEKARSTLVGHQPGRKRVRTEKNGRE